MPFKRKGSPFYQIRRRNLVGYGDTGQLSSEVTSKKVARDMERLLEEIAQRALSDPTWTALLDAVIGREVSLPELLTAKNQRQMESLKKTLRDPSLDEAVRAFRPLREHQRLVQVGLGQLLQYAPDGARLSVLRDGRAITEICHACANDPKEPRKRNTVRRQMLRAISLMVRHYMGNAERDRIFDDVNFSAEDDTREVKLSPAEIRRLLDACEEIGWHELAVLIRVAIQTSADRGILLSGPAHHGKVWRGLLARDLAIYHVPAEGRYEGEVYLPDTKTKNRSRTVRITDMLCRELLHLTKEKDPDEPVFNMRYMDLDYPWKETRKRAKLQHVRFKDLRAQFSIYAEKANVPLTVVSKTMGNTEGMARRYQQHNAVMTAAQAQAVESELYPNLNRQPTIEPTQGAASA